MKRFVLVIFAALLLFSCSKSDDSVSSIIGSWELMSIETKSVVIDSTVITVFITFEPDRTFSMEQKVGEGRFVSYSGTYSLSEGILSGVYSDGSAWGDSYSVTINGDTMKLTSSSGKETDTYKRK